MVEVPEFYVRVDWTDGLSWKNAAGADIGGEYKLLNPSGMSSLDPLRVYYVLPKAQYDELGDWRKKRNGLGIQHFGLVGIVALIALFTLTA